MTQLVARIPDDLVRQIDELVEDDIFESRSAAVREGLRQLVDTHHRRTVAKAIIGGYQRTDVDDGLWSDHATVEMIGEEAW